jgi:hypothetical protein
MHKINAIFFEYIVAPTAAVAHVVAMWSFIGGSLKTWFKKRRKKKTQRQLARHSAERNKANSRFAKNIG